MKKEVGSGVGSGSGSESISQRYGSGSAQKCHGSPTLIHRLNSQLDWTHLGARDKTRPLAISGHPSNSAYPSILNSVALYRAKRPKVAVL